MMDYTFGQYIIVVSVSIKSLDSEFRPKNQPNFVVLSQSIFIKSEVTLTYQT